MKKHLPIVAPFLLGLSMAGCHSQSAHTVAAVSAPGVSARSALAAEQPITAALPQAVPDSLRLLQTLDLAPLWMREDDGKPAKSAMDGFYGADQYHIAFYFDSVQRDARQPALYHVWGRDRYKHITTPFAGTCTITRLLPLADTVSMKDSQTAPAYSALATFTLREDPSTKGAGTYNGQAYLDFCLDRAGQPVQCEFMDMDAGAGNPTKGVGLLFRGEWRSNNTGQTKPVAWASWYGAVVPDALRKLGLGERGEEVNPKLARYGWGEKWENDEWWADSPKPSMNL